MTAHELATKLLSGPDLPVTFADDYGSFEVSDFSVGKDSFNGEGDTADTPRDRLGYTLQRPCISLIACAETPPSQQQIAEKQDSVKRMEEDRKRLTPQAFALKWACIEPLTPDALVKMVNVEVDLAAKLKK